MIEPTFTRVLEIIDSDIASHRFVAQCVQISDRHTAAQKIVSKGVMDHTIEALLELRNKLTKECVL